MAVDVTIPTLGESVTEGVVVRWIRADGETISEDEPLLELETDKASVEIPAPATGIVRVLKAEGETVRVGEVVARIEEARPGAAAGREERPAAVQQEGAALKAKGEKGTGAEPAAGTAPPPGPAARRLLEEHDLDASVVPATGRGGRVTKADVLRYLREHERAEEPQVEEGASKSDSVAAPSAPQDYKAPPATPPPAEPRPAGERRVPMTHLRRRIAERLVQAQQTAAILTTFNEIDMSGVMELRARHRDRFAEVHGVRLGFVSFFARACVAAIHDVPVINARIEGNDIVYPDGVHLGIAVATERGLVVPIIRHADKRSLADIEREIARLADLARNGKLGISDLSGGTFTISNGGVFGSLLSTPILNPPQSAILGMHKVEKRPVVVDDQIVVRPMMYVALSYDHRLIDGAEAVTFLVRVKERLEDPARLFLEI